MVNKTLEYNVINVLDGQTNKSDSLALDVSNDNANYIVHRALEHQNVLSHQYTSSTKTRSEVRGGGRKPWKQKGTGRARAGSSRSPLWKGGGVIFGPKPRNVSLKLNKKERRLALQTLLYNKKNSILMIDNLENEIVEAKTKNFLKVCESCAIDLEQKVLIVVSKKTIPLKLATQNLKNVELILASNLNTFSLLKAKQIILTPLALADIKEMYCD